MHNFCDNAAYTKRFTTFTEISQYIYGEFRGSFETSHFDNNANNKSENSREVLNLLSSFRIHSTRICTYAVFVTLVSRKVRGEYLRTYS